MGFILSIIIFLSIIFLLVKILDNSNDSKTYHKTVTITETIRNEMIRETIPKLYKQKGFMTRNERYFYTALKYLEKELDLIVHPQANLATIVEKVNKNKYHNELFRNIDFAIFTKDYKKLLLLIEINDATHNQYKRRQRDKKVKEICKIANINLITFYTKYTNKTDYIINRVKQNLPKEILNNGFPLGIKQENKINI